MTIYDFSAASISGEQVELDRFRGKVLLIVNVASHCGFTPQYTGLEQLYRRFRDRGFEILGFPCNQFGEQEPGDEKEIRQFCSLNYDVTFPLFAKVDVNGPTAHPLFRYLKNSKKGWLATSKIKWNFTKFLIDRNGNPIKRFGSWTKPEKIAVTIESLLAY